MLVSVIGSFIGTFAAMVVFVLLFGGTDEKEPAKEEKVEAPIEKTQPVKLEPVSISPEDEYEIEMAKGPKRVGE